MKSTLKSSLIPSAQQPRDKKGHSKFVTRQDVLEQKQRARIANLEKLFAKKRQDMLQSRLDSKPISSANKNTIMNDEYRLRQDLEFGHPVDQRDPVTGRAVLTEAVAAGHFSIVRMLIHDFDVNIAVPTLLGAQTALHLAVAGNHRQIASLLITYGADVNARDAKGCTPMHMVRSLPLAKLLMKFEVDLLAKTNEEQLRPSSWYQKKVDPEERSLEFYNFLALKESREETRREQERIKTAQLEKRRKTLEKIMNKRSDISVQSVVESNI